MKINEQIKKFDWNTINNKNCIRFDNNSSLEHKLTIIDICVDLLQKKTDFYTRARLKFKPYHKNQLVADIYIPEWNEVIEVKHKESKESIERKKILWVKDGFNFGVIESIYIPEWNE